jgi:serine/threonine protein kinase
MFDRDGILSFWSNIKKKCDLMNQFIYNSCFIQFAAGLRLLHKKGVAHRDLKHENILIARKSFS